MPLALPRPFFLALQEDFNQIEDPRVERTRLHCLADILLLSLASICCGAESYEDIQVWSMAHGTEALRELLGVALENGIPHHDTFRRVLSRLKPESLQSQLEQLRHTIAPPKHIAVDGKFLNGSHKKGKNPLCLLSVFATEANLVIGQKKVDVKSNEIPAAQEILALLCLKGSTVTADAMHCQKETAQVIRKQGGDYLLAVKENQGKLYEAIVSLFKNNTGTVAVEQVCLAEKNRGRIEVRQGSLVRIDDWLPSDDPLRVWCDWHSVLCLESERKYTQRGEEKSSYFVRYYITSHALDVTSLMGFARSHWGIENSLHWVLDVSFGEDASRIRTDYGAHNMASLRRLSHHLLSRVSPSDVCGENAPSAIAKMSMKKRRKWAGWRNDYLQAVLRGQERETKPEKEIGE